MNFIKSSKIQTKIKGRLYTNWMINLDNVILFKKMEHTGAPPDYHTISFFTTIKNDISWYYKTSEERDDVYTKIMEYIRTHQKNVKI